MDLETMTRGLEGLRSLSEEIERRKLVEHDKTEGYLRLLFVNILRVALNVRTFPRVYKLYAAGSQELDMLKQALTQDIKDGDIVKAIQSEEEEALLGVCTCLDLKVTSVKAGGITLDKVRKACDAMDKMWTIANIQDMLRTQGF